VNPRLVDPASRKIVAILGVGAVLSGGVEIGGKRYKLTIRYYDDESTARSSELAERLIKEDGVKLMLGPYSSGLTQAMPPIVVEKYQVPMVEGNGAARELFPKAYRHIFAVPTTQDQYLVDAIELAAENAGKLGQGGRRGHSGVAFISLTAVIAPLSC
jgi:branched-chain amino acid transport system substrate-binding protein